MSGNLAPTLMAGFIVVLLPDPSLTRRHQRANGNLPDAACAGSSLYSAPATRAPAMVPIRPKINHTRGTKRPTALHEACARFPGTFIISPRTTPTVSAVFGPGPRRGRTAA